MIFADTETLPFGPCAMAPELVCLQFGDSSGVAIATRVEAEDCAREVLRHDTCWVNAPYDMAVLAANFPDLLPVIVQAYDEDRVYDLAIRQRLIDLAAGSLGWAEIEGKNTKLVYSLAELALRHLGLVLPKGEETWRMRYGELMGVPVAQWPEEAVAYAELDVLVPAQVWERQPPHVVDEHRQVKADFWTHLASCWGMTTSPEAVAAFEAEARANYRRLADALVASGLKRPDRVNTKGVLVEGSRDAKTAMAMLEQAYTGRGLAVPRTPTGKVALDDAKCIASGDPRLADYGAFGSASKVLSSDVALLHQYGNPIHTRFHALLKTSDIGSSKPNLVNLPTRPGVRECFVPPPGFVYLACDYAGIQLRTWAQACINLLGYSEMAEYLNSGRDPHLKFAAHLLDITYEEACERPKKRGAEGSIYFERQCGKVGNFGKPGGMGPDRLVESAAKQYGVIITREQAVRLDRIWRRWREAGPYLDLVSRMTRNGKIKIAQMYSGRVRGGLSYCDTANGIFSAIAYDALKDAGWLVMKDCYVNAKAVLFGSRIVNVIHDELLLVVPEPIGHECAEAVSAHMVEAAKKWIPDVPAKVEATLMRRWSKAAEPTYENGRLVAWE